MRQLLSVVILLIFSLSAMGQKRDIVALVNDEPITFNEFQARKKMWMIFNNQDGLDAAQDKHFSDLAVKSLVHESLIVQNYDEEEVAQEEIDNAIRAIEERNHMPSGYMLQYLRSKGADVANSFVSYIKADLMKTNILSALSGFVQVSPREIDTTVLSFNKKDAYVSLQAFVSKNKDHNTLMQMNKLSKKLKGCGRVDKSLYSNFADIKNIRSKLSDLSTVEQTIVKDLNVHQVSNVFEMNDKFHIISVCNKKILGISDDEHNSVMEVLANKQFTHKAQKLLHDMYRKAYIKIMLP